MRRTRARSGYTLVDVLIVLFVLGILLSAAAPDLGRANRRYAAIGAARQLRADLVSVRMDAILRGSTVTVAIDTVSGTWEASDAGGTVFFARRVPDSVALRTSANRQSIPFTARGTTDLYSTTWIGPATDPEGKWHAIRVAPSGAVSSL